MITTILSMRSKTQDSLWCNAYLVGGPEACGEHSDLQVHGQGLVSCVLTLPVLKALLLVTRQLQVSHHTLHLQPQLALVSTNALLWCSMTLFRHGELTCVVASTMQGSADAKYFRSHASITETRYEVHTGVMPA